MTVIALDIYPEDDPNGTPLVTLTDEDIGSFKMRKGENELGEGLFTIRRDHAAATEANLRAGNYVKVRIPVIDTDPIFGFWLDEQTDVILAAGEEGGETLTRSGPGPLAILRNAAFLDDHYATAPPASDDRGNSAAPPGYWQWKAKQYGQILKRFLEEGQTQPGTPLIDVTTDFDRDVDSDGVDWPDILREVQFPIGSDGLQVYEAFASTGELWVRVTPDLLVSAYFLFRGVDRTSATFASGKARFVKGINIDTDLTRQGNGLTAATHALVIGTNNKFRQVVSPGYVPGTPGRWIIVNREEFNDEDVLDKVGATSLQRSADELEAFEFELHTGDAEPGRGYMPFVDFDTGDLVTVHTGSGPWDFNEADVRITGIRIEVREASRDETDDIARKSLAIVVECGGGRQGFGSVSVDPHESLGGSFFQLDPLGTFFSDGAIAFIPPYKAIGANDNDADDGWAYFYMEHDAILFNMQDDDTDAEHSRYAAIEMFPEGLYFEGGLYIFDILDEDEESKFYFNDGWGIVIPRLAADPSTSGIFSEEGQEYWNTVSHTRRQFNGTAWEDVGVASADAFWTLDDTTWTADGIRLAGAEYIGLTAGDNDHDAQIYFQEAGTDGAAIDIYTFDNTSAWYAEVYLRSDQGRLDLYASRRMQFVIDGGGADESFFDFRSGGDAKAIAFPELTADPSTTGLSNGIYFNTSTSKHRAWNGTAWVNLY